MVVNVLAATSWERYIVLVPALVIGVGLVLGIFILLGRGLAQTIRESTHPRWIVTGLLALAGVIVLLTYLGVNLPKE